MFKIYNNQAPEYLIETFNRVATPYDTRDSSSKSQLSLPKTNYGKKRFGYRGAEISNNLPENLRLSESLNTFKTKLNGIPPCFFFSLVA